jgi:hypothetical protein
MKKNDFVIFQGASPEQIKWGGNDNPNQILEIGSKYQISNVEVHTWHTKISLVGYKGKFNSVSFDKL